MTTKLKRRTVLESMAGLAMATQARTAVAAAPAKAEGRAGEFNFLAGEWKVKHRRRKGDGWDTFEGEATCWTILAGVGSIEELRIPARNFSGLGLRLLDLEKKVWNDFWVNGRSGVLTTPGMAGSFENGVGTFQADDLDGETPIVVRGVWDQITPKSCRWRQLTSRDAGKTWVEDWVMAWSRA